jgi:hypothetical protein
MTSDDRINAIKLREQAATPGPWTGDPEPYAIYIYGADRSPVADAHVPGCYGDGTPAPDFDDGARGGVDAVLRLRGVGASKNRPEGSLEANYAFMINARDDVRWLLERLGAERAENARLKRFEAAVVAYSEAVSAFEAAEIGQDGDQRMEMDAAERALLALAREVRP